MISASVAELVDALDLKSNWYLNASAGSSPARGTSSCLNSKQELFFCIVVFYGFAGREACPERSRSKPGPEVQP